ncbi:hypothetical protein C8J55DRAFT_503113 [Lentinula edodes]|uniref:Uncharacterized protein n=1 Tax=Lentinula lateritia TaxID=40482 RepID=A0A9W9AWT2_9AGAR|nr:hypothetical protein C8J55DRAFT_503113 [Lentinula edodes]
MWGMGIGGREPSVLSLLSAGPSGLTRQPLHNLALPSSLSHKRRVSAQHHDDEDDHNTPLPQPPLKLHQNNTTSANDKQPSLKLNNEVEVGCPPPG